MAKTGKLKAALLIHTGGLNTGIFSALSYRSDAEKEPADVQLIECSEGGVISVQ